MDRAQLEQLIRQVLAEKLGENPVKFFTPDYRMAESDRLDTGNPADRVFTHDLLSLEDSPRLGLGLMTICLDAALRRDRLRVGGNADHPHRTGRGHGPRRRGCVHPARHGDPFFRAGARALSLCHLSCRLAEPKIRQAGTKVPACLLIISFPCRFSGLSVRFFRRTSRQLCCPPTR